jgi:regulator of protease activity HflC (stomatin/prohibitin superfamily)
MSFLNFLISAGITFMGLFIIVPIIFGLMRVFGFYAVVEEGTTHVYVLFGKVIAVLDEPGFYILWFQLGPAALIVNWLGKRYVVDRRLDQTYLRSQPVNSEEGAPMGIGVWYEMWISDPVSYLFKNTDPRGSLAANVSSATVRCLSNLSLEEMLENRHTMSYTVRNEVAPKSRDWGFDLGSVYIRKVHFRDTQMIRQIEEKVVNRLRQVTSAIKQDGANQVGIITSTADRQAAIEFAKAAAMRPRIVGQALQKIGQNREVLATMFDILEAQRIIEGEARITILPTGSELLGKLAAVEDRNAAVAPPPFKR